MGFRYIGAKTQLIDFVTTTIAEIVKPGSCVADLMCGTGAVSAALRVRGYKVIANDVMTYSYHHARVLLEFTDSPEFLKAQRFIRKHSKPGDRGELFPPTNYELVIDALNRSGERRGYFWREFSLDGNPQAGERPRNYFTPKNASKIDGIRSTIRRLAQSGALTELEHSLLVHDLVMASNDVANIAGTYGHFLSKTVERAKIPIVLTPTNLIVRNDPGIHQVHKKYAEELAETLDCDLCYIDPPYMKRQYAANYHVLETIARGDSPRAIGASGLRPWRDQYSNFCTKTKIRDSFRQIVARARCKHFLVSYSEDGLLSIDELRALLEEFGRVKISSFRNKRFKSNESKLASTLSEYLVHLTR